MVATVGSSTFVLRLWLIGDGLNAPVGFAPLHETCDPATPVARKLRSFQPRWSFRLFRGARINGLVLAAPVKRDITKPCSIALTSDRGLEAALMTRKLGWLERSSVA